MHICMSTFLLYVLKNCNNPDLWQYPSIIIAKRLANYSDEIKIASFLFICLIQSYGFRAKSIYIFVVAKTQTGCRPDGGSDEVGLPVPVL